MRRRGSAPVVGPANETYRRAAASVCFLHCQGPDPHARFGFRFRGLAETLSVVPQMSEYLVDSSRRAREPVIVLAEDDEDIRRVYGLILRHYGCRVEEALDGREAIEVVRATKPDLVLMDVSLPAMDGVAASRALKADAATRDIPILAFSADISTTADMPTPNNTFDGYILKPISPTELARRVTAYVRRGSASHGVGEAREVEVSHLERGHYDVTT